MTHRTKLILAASAIALCLCANAHAITIAAGNAEDTLSELGYQSGKDVFWDALVLDSTIQTHAVKETQWQEALRKMLLGTGFSYTLTNLGVISIDKITEPAAVIRPQRHPDNIGPRCACPILGGEPTGPWCWDEHDELLYAPDLCPR